jgi:hypothetical protein
MFIRQGATLPNLHIRTSSLQNKSQGFLDHTIFAFPDDLSLRETHFIQGLFYV